MAISYTEKGAGLHEAVEEAGEGLWQADGVWYSTNDVVVQPIIDSFDQLAYEKQQKVKAIRIEGASRATDIFSFMGDNPETALDFYRFGSLIIDCIDPAARDTIPADLLSVKAIYDAGVAAIQTVNALTTVAEVLAYDAVNAPAWP